MLLEPIGYCDFFAGLYYIRKDMKLFIIVVFCIVLGSFKSSYALSLKGHERWNCTQEIEETDYNGIFETIPEERKRNFYAYV